MGVLITTADAMALIYDRGGNTSVTPDRISSIANAFNHVAGAVNNEPQEGQLFNGTNYVFNGGQLLTGQDLSYPVAVYHGWTSDAEKTALDTLKTYVNSYGALDPFEMGSLIYSNPSVADALDTLAP
jgi:hypothetical protein